VCVWNTASHTVNTTPSNVASAGHTHTCLLVAAGLGLERAGAGLRDAARRRGMLSS